MMMASTRRRAANQDLPRQPSLIPSSSLSPLLADNNAGSISMDDFLKNIYSDPTTNTITSTDALAEATIPPSPDPSPPLFHPAGNDEVWSNIVADTTGAAGSKPQMTLEDFLTKASIGPAQLEAAAAAGPGPGPSMVSNGSLIQQHVQLGVAGVGRGKRRAAAQEEPPVDRATQQKQRRMIKNRESAARSRERKQAYTQELETLVTRLEDEHARLSREEVDVYKERCEELEKYVIPVTEGRRPQRIMLQRMNSF